MLLAVRRKMEEEEEEQEKKGEEEVCAPPSPSQPGGCETLVCLSSALPGFLHACRSFPRHPRRGRAPLRNLPFTASLTVLSIYHLSFPRPATLLCRQDSCTTDSFFPFLHEAIITSAESHMSSQQVLSFLRSAIHNTDIYLVT